MICSFECSKSTNRSLFNGYHSLFNVKIESNSETLYPFHGLLAELAITVLMIKFNDLPYKAKKESLMYNLEDMREKFLTTNTTLGLPAINITEIGNLINLLRQCTLKKPIVSPDKVNFFVKTSIAALVIGSIVCRQRSGA